jgi:hypothetical protein
MRKFEVGDELKFDGVGHYTAKKGATAICKGFKECPYGTGEYVIVKWIRNSLSGNQNDGSYYEDQFKKVNKKDKKV